MKNRPPYIANLILRLILNKDEYLEKSGDMEEVYFSIREETNKINAAFWYWYQVVKAIPGLISSSFLWGVTMYLNYIKIAVRNIKKSKVYSLINISTLALGIVCGLLIFMFINEELSFDNYHKDGDQVFRVYEEISSPTATKLYAPIAWPVAPTLLKEYSQVKYSARIYTYSSTKLVKYKENNFYEPNFIYGEEDIFNILTFNFIQGNPKTALSQPNTVVLTKTIADKYFIDENPINKLLKINGADFTVTGVIEDLPYNTHLKFQMIASLITIENERWWGNWYGTECYTYIKLLPNVNPTQFASQIKTIGNNYIAESVRQRGKFHRFYLQRVSDIHFNPELSFEMEPPGNIFTIILFSIIGFFVLLIASLNYMNLATAKSLCRAKEVGLRKVVGGNKRQIATQFYCESIIFTFISIITALIIALILLPYFNELSGTLFKYSDLFKLEILAGLLIIGLFIGLVAGSYPALFISSFKPVAVLGGSFKKSKKGSSIQKAIVIFQFSLSLLLIIGTSVIYRQISFMQTEKLGFSKEQKLIIPIRGGASIRENYEQIKNTLKQNPNIWNVTASSTVPGNIFSSFNVKTIQHSFQFDDGLNHLFIDPDFITTYDIELLAGRDFQHNISDDKSDWDKRTNFIINASAAKAFGMIDPQDAIGLQIKSGLGAIEGEIIGVTKNFHYKGLQTSVEPLIISWFPTRYNYLTLLISTKNISGTIDYIKEKWEELYPNSLLAYSFLDEDFDNLYSSERQTAQITTSFTIIGIFIACIGLLALVSLIVEQRRKEIGIRKVLGSSTSNIVILFNKEFIKWILISNAIAWPIAYWLMNSWLSDFAYRIQLTLDIFLYAGILSILIAVTTVSWQTIKASLVNPVKSLKCE